MSSTDVFDVFASRLMNTAFGNVTATVDHGLRYDGNPTMQARSWKVGVGVS